MSTPIRVKLVFTTGDEAIVEANRMGLEYAEAYRAATAEVRRTRPSARVVSATRIVETVEE
jgi:hypothetical protein